MFDSIDRDGHRAGARSTVDVPPHFDVSFRREPTDFALATEPQSGQFAIRVLDDNLSAD
jgi:hypothetical protein